MLNSLRIAHCHSRLAPTGGEAGGEADDGLYIPAVIRSRHALGFVMLLDAVVEGFPICWGFQDEC
jgi:hypothetical protein